MWGTVAMVVVAWCRWVEMLCSFAKGFDKGAGGSKILCGAVWRGTIMEQIDPLHLTAIYN